MALFRFLKVKNRCVRIQDLMMLTFPDTDPE